MKRTEAKQETKAGQFYFLFFLENDECILLMSTFSNIVIAEKKQVKLLQNITTAISSLIF